MDFSLGASQGQGTPAERQSEGLAVHLQLGVATVSSGSLISMPVPGPQNLTGDLISGGGFMHGLTDAEKGVLKGVIAGRVISEFNSNTSAIKSVKLDESSIVDLGPFVKDGQLDWAVPEGNATWRVFAFWEGFTNQVSCSGGVNGSTTIEKGSMVVDHFSEEGARVHTSFFDRHVFSGQATRERLKSNGRYAWEDSMELLFVLPWTRGFLDRFKATHGYSLIKYLPLLFNKENSWAKSYAPYSEVYVYGEYDTDSVSIHNANYRWTLSDCYREYLDYHVRWARSHGIEFSTQVSYNLPLSFLNEIPSVDGPEGESLGFKDLLDAYRSLAGPAQLSGKSDISSEVGAVFRPAFSQPIPDLLRSITRSYAGGLTMMVIHGMAYSGPYVKTSWPGYQPFSYRTTESWSRVQPAWQHMDDILAYLGRTQHILKTGKPRVDLAMFYSTSRWEPAQIYDSDNLQTQGFTYNFLGPETLQLPSASVSGKLLGPDGPGYKALIFLNATQVDENVLSRVREFDRAGLPVFFVGEVQELPISLHPNGTYNMVDRVKALISRGKNIHHVDSTDDLPAALAKARITPRVRFISRDSSVLNVYRAEPEYERDYIWLLNDANTTISIVIDVEVGRNKLPFSFDAWTGDVRPMAQYSFSQDRMQVPIQLQPYQTTIVGLKSSGGKIPVHVTNVTGQIEAVDYSVDGKLYASIRGPSAVTVRGGKEQVLNAAVPSPSIISAWDLEIQDWRGNPDQTASIEPQITLHKFSNQSLVLWKDISTQLVSVSGIGTYSASFTVPDVRDIGAYLSVGPILHTLRAWVNDHQIGPFGADNAKVDISKHLRRRQINQIKIEVTTTLFNRLRADMNSTMLMGYPLSVMYPTYASTESQSYGLHGPVVLHWVVKKKVV
ncbi:hypothetical protein BJX99DRAFT_234972 [Aspergillus californicus]